MIISVDLNREDVKRLSEVQKAIEARTRSESFRHCLRESHKKIFSNSLPIDSEEENENQSENQKGKQDEKQF